MMLKACLAHHTDCLHLLSGVTLVHLAPALIRALQHNSTPRALYGVLVAAHVAITHHGVDAIALAAPQLHAALPRLMMGYILVYAAGQQTPAGSQPEANGSGKEQGFEPVLRLLAAAPVLLMTLLDSLTAIAAADHAGSGQDALPSAVETGLASGRCLLQILAAYELRLQVIDAESNIMRLLQALSQLPRDDSGSGVQELRHLCSTLRQCAMDAFGRGVL